METIPHMKIIEYGVIPRSEYPRPQMVREKWINLNGCWDFEIDHGKSGRERSLYDSSGLNEKIMVPFCPESKLSGVEYKDFMSSVWYRREFEVTDEWLSNKVLIHFGAVDYDAQIWINGASVGTHKGGYTPFSFDITRFIKLGKNVVVVCAEDDSRSGEQPRGKQASSFLSKGCDYTRTTGIWQTVWLECVPDKYITDIKYISDIPNACLHITVTFNTEIDGYTLLVESEYDGRKTGAKKSKVFGRNINFTLKISEVNLWEPGNGRLYSMKLFLNKDNEIIDTVDSYFGLRNVILKGKAILINNVPVFQRLVLDQGYYKEGIYTAPSGEELKRDIEISMNMGFNGARLHQKVFEPLYLYWADKLGYMVWGEHANWGLDITTPAGLERFLPEWMEVVDRDFNHPSIIGWCPFNETWDVDWKWIHTAHREGIRQDDEVLRIVYNFTKAIDKTRPVIDTSGNFHVVTDIFDIHDYEQDPVIFASKFEPMKTGGEAYVTFPDRQKYEGQPYFVSEYGGIGFNNAQSEQPGWSYGSRTASEEEFIDRYEKLTVTLLENPNICAFCYTQLYDVEQEVNGLYTYERVAKLKPEIIRQINTTKAAIERDII